VTDTVAIADVFCFQGGADINPALYDEKPMPRTVFNKDRDRIDLDAWEQAHDKIKVGICRGGQFLNVMNEGSMWQHVNNHMGSHVITNLLEIPGSVFGAGSEIKVTSDHHQMMIPNLHYGEVLGICDRATEFVTDNPDREYPKYDTEIVFYGGTQSLCFQAHPEYNFEAFCRTYFFKLMEFFFK
jgi:hypothetical protein